MLIVFVSGGTTRCLDIPKGIASTRCSLDISKGIALARCSLDISKGEALTFGVDGHVHGG